MFLMRNRKGVGPDGRGAGGEELGRVNGGENTTRVYYMRKNLFTIKEKCFNFKKLKPTLPTIPGQDYLVLAYPSFLDEPYKYKI